MSAATAIQGEASRREHRELEYQGIHVDLRGVAPGEDMVKAPCPYLLFVVVSEAHDGWHLFALADRMISSRFVVRTVQHDTLDEGEPRLSLRPARDEMCMCVCCLRRRSRLRPARLCYLVACQQQPLCTFNNGRR